MSFWITREPPKTLKTKKREGIVRLAEGKFRRKEQSLQLERDEGDDWVKITYAWIGKERSTMETPKTLVCETKKKKKKKRKKKKKKKRKERKHRHTDF